VRDNEWLLRYGSTSYTFGPADLDVVNMSAPDMSDVEVRADDFDRPRSDGRAFGSDFRGARTITFSLGVLGESEAEVRDRLAVLSNVWRADAVRSTPGALAEMVVQYAGRERSCFGRPRKFAHSDEDAAQGFIPVTATFDTADDLWYSATSTDQTLSIAGGVGGGLLAPLASPLGTTQNSDRSVAIEARGDLPAWPVITISGPITNPEIEVMNLWKIRLATTIAEGQSVVIDTRPWARTVVRSDGASLAGAFTRDSRRLSNAYIPAGRYELAFRGSSPTGTATAHLSWRDTYSSL
jgi:hypothetical protein